MKGILLMDAAGSGRAMKGGMRESRFGRCNRVGSPSLVITLYRKTKILKITRLTSLFPWVVCKGDSSYPPYAFFTMSLI